MKPEKKKYQVLVGDKPFSFETGRLAEQAGGAVTAQLDESVVFSAATMSEDPREGINFFPLTVNFEARMYAGGSIPGGFFRREGRPGENATLASRVIDRAIRPLFPDDMQNAVQVILYSLSADGKQPLDVLGLNAASASLMISDITWDGPIAAVRVGRIDGQFVANPTFQQLEESDLDLVMAGSRDAVLMVESFSDQISEEDMVEAIDYGQLALQPLIDLQDRMVREVGKEKRQYPSFAISEDIKTQVRERVSDPIQDILTQEYEKTDLGDAIGSLKDEVVEEIAGEDESLVGDVKDAFEEVYKKAVRARILDAGKRPDGRGYKDVRNVWCDVDTSPQAHGSAIFTRGQTQVMTLATLGTPRDAQMIDNLTPTETKRYMHHYNFPPFSVGEVRFLRGASRREIGHGVLAEKALLPMIPSEEEFPYTLRLVSEVLSSNGSSSMASVCGSTLALMDTGVPIKGPVSGVAMGLVKDGERYAILTDIQGLEDGLGDMDFKVAGTKKGITALQMDIKVKGLSTEIMAEALAQANEARSSILEVMLDEISRPREELKSHVPRMQTIRIDPEKIGMVIGPSGKTIREIQEDTGAEIDIEDDGTVFIATADGESARMARERIELLTASAEVGRIYTGKVVGVKDYGAFVEILPGTDGLVHISQLESRHVKSVSDVVDYGDEITVMVTDISDDGKIRLSRQAVLEGWTLEEARQNDRKS